MTGSVIIVMGVSGSGKTSVGSAIAEARRMRFLDGDDLHPRSNIDKMSQGIPLTDEDRTGWLDTIVQEATAAVQKNEAIVITCSALKRRYRDRLRAGIEVVTFVYLRAAYRQVWQQLQARRGHFMPVHLLQSQFDLLEEPGEDETVITVAIKDSLEKTIAAALGALH